MKLFSHKKPADGIDTTVNISLPGIQKGHHNTKYRGANCVKSPFDYVIYQMIIEEVRPDLIIEIGAFEGGSALYMADLLDHYGKGEVHTIDIEDRMDPKAKEHKRIKFFCQDWREYDLSLTKNFQTVLVIEDGSHKYPETLEAMISFAEVVSKNSYLIVEDGIVDALGLSSEHNGGPVRAIKQFIRARPDFEIDYKWCDFFGKNATFNVIGYLKKIS